MISLIKTQCPTCHTLFSLAPAQLSKAEAKARCGNCQQVFLVNEHLVETESESLTKTATLQKLTTANTQKTVNQQSGFLDSDTLTHDDMPHADMQDNDAEDNSLDEMDAWLSQPNSASIDNIIQSSRSQSNPSNHSFTVTTQKTTPTAAPKSKTATNHAVDTDDKSMSRSTSPASASDTNLSQLLTNMGVPEPSNITALSSKQTNTTPSNSSAGQAQAQHPAALILWLSGCLVLVMLLFAQYVIFNLETLIKDPDHAARLQAVCAVAVCSLPSADLTTLNITNLNVRPSNIKAADEFSDIEAWLVNQSLQPQLLPSLKVSIYGADSLIGEFIAMPGDYLASPQNLLTAEQIKPLMFTIPITQKQIREITIDPIY